MKKFMKSLAFVAVAAMGFTACENSVDSQNGVEKVAYEIAVQADDTRSIFGDKEDGSYPTLWSGDEVVKVTLNAGDVQDATLTTSNGGADAKIKVELATGAKGTLHVLTPFNTGDYAIGGFNGINTQYSDYYVTIPVEQTPCANSVDESAHLLFGECEVSNAMSVTMKHVAAYGKMTIKNFAPAIKSIELTSPVNFVGQGCYYYYAGEKVGQLANAKSTTLTLNAANVENNVFWFTCAPVGTLAANMTVVITDSEDNTYTKELAATGKLAFEQGKVSNFSVDMTGIEKDVVEEVEGLADGDYAVLKAKKNGTGYWAMDIAKNSDRQVAVECAWDGKATSVAVDESCIWTLTKSGSNYTLQQGDKYVAFMKGGVTLAKTATELSFTANDNGSYVVADETTTDSNASSRRLTVNEGYGFGFYTASSGAWEIFMVPAHKDTAPKLEVVAQPEEVAAAGDDVTVALTVKNLTETITVTPSESWITNAVVVNNNKQLTFTVAENDKEETREATITLKANGLTAVVTVNQKAKPAAGEVELSVAYTFVASNLGQGYGVQTGKASNNGVKFTVTCGQGTYVGSNSSKKANCVLGNTYAKVGTPCGYNASTKYVVAVISESKMSNVGKVVVYNNSDNDSTAPTKISLVYSKDGSTYTLVETQNYSKTGNTWEFDVVDSAYYAVVMCNSTSDTSYIRTNNLKIDYYSAN